MNLFKFLKYFFFLAYFSFETTQLALFKLSVFLLLLRLNFTPVPLRVKLVHVSYLFLLVGVFVEQHSDSFHLFFSSWIRLSFPGFTR